MPTPNLRDYSAIVSLTHSWHNPNHGQKQESVRICFCVLADTITEAKQKTREVVKEWVESEWPELSGMPEEWADCYWHSIDSLDIGIGSNPVIL